jgi:hypothetical protein
VQIETEECRVCRQSKRVSRGSTYQQIKYSTSTVQVPVRVLASGTSASCTGRVVVVVAVVLVVLVLGASRATPVLVPLLLVLVLVPVLAVNLLYHSTAAETCAERSEIRLLRLDDALMT